MSQYHDPNGPVDNLLNIYLNQEGIDHGYSQLILKELHDATEMSDEQLNQAANEIIVGAAPQTSHSVRSAPTLPLPLPRANSRPYDV